MSVTSKLDIKFRAREYGTHDLGVPGMDHVLDFYKELGDGTTSGNADLIWSDTRNLAATSEDLDLSGALLKALGGNFTAAKVVGLIIRNNATVAGAKLTVGGAASNQFFNGLFGGAAHQIEVKPAGILVWFSPIDAANVTGGTGDLLKVDAGANTVSYTIVVLARSV